MKNTIEATAAHDLKAGDFVHVSGYRRHWFKRLILFLAFWYKPKPTVYKITEVSATTFTYEVE